MKLIKFSRQDLHFFQNGKIRIYAFFLFASLLGVMLITQNTKAQTATNGACVVRGTSGSLPGYNDPNSGNGYFKVNKPGVTTLEALATQCTTAEYSQMVTSYCSANTGTVNLDMVIYDENGAYLSNSCPSWGCSTSCPSPVDTQAPTVPTGLAGGVNGSTVTLAWAMSTDNIGVVAYKIFRNGALLISVTTGPSYSDTVPSAGSYTYYVKAVDAAGNESGQSNTVSVTAGSTATAPLAPSSLTATVSGTSVTLNWTDNSNNETGFKVYKTISNLWTDIGNVAANVTTFTDVNVTSGTSYSYRVQAFNQPGTGSVLYSALSLTVSVTVGGSGNATTSPVTVDVKIDGSDSALSRTAPASYTVSWSSTNAVSCSSTGTWGTSAKSVSGSQSFTGVTVLATNTYGLVCTGLNYSNASDSVSVTISAASTATTTTSTAPVAPSGLTATVSNSVVTLHWTDNSSNEAGFKIYRNSGSGWTDVGNVGANITTFSSSSLSAGTYYFKVNAFNSSYVYSGVSNEVTATISTTSGNGTGATSGTLNGVCLIRDADTLAPLYSSADVSSGYAKVAKPGYDTISALQTACTEVDYQALFLEYCKSNTKPAMKQVALYDANGNVQSSNCGASGCGYSSCPTQTTTATTTVATSALPTIEVKVDGVKGAVSKIAPASYTVSWVASNASSCRQTGTWGWDWGVKPTTSAWSFTGVTVLGGKTYTVECKNLTGQTVSATAYVDITAAATATTTVPVIMQPVVDAMIGGQVLGASGQPLANVGVHVYKPDFSFNSGGVTDSNGYFQIAVASGSYLVEAFPPSSAANLVKPTPLSVNINSGETKQVILKFTDVSQSIKVLKGVVKFSNQELVTDAEIGAYNSVNGQWFKVLTNQSGEYVLNLNPGVYKIGIRPVDPKIAVWQWSEVYETVDFSATAPETKMMNFNIQLPENKVIISAVDQDNNLLPNVGVIISSLVSGSTNLGTQLFRKTENDGAVTFLLKSGQYRVVASLPPNSGFLNPEKQEFSVAVGEEKKLVFMFKKPETANTAVLKGSVRTENNEAVSEAAVWGWSSKGGFLEAKTNELGQYLFTVPLGSQWHLGAGKKIGSYPFKSSDITVNVNEPVVYADLFLIQFSDKILSEPVNVTKPATQSIIAQTQSGAEVVIPAGASGGAGDLSLRLAPTIEAPSQAESRVVGTVYDVNLKDSTGNEIKTLVDEIEITIPYDEKALKKSGTLEGKISPSYYDEEAGAWVKVDKYVVDKDANQVKIFAKHLTRFALVAPADTVAPMPVTNAYIWLSGKQAVSLAWTDPKIDFHHTKVYRSEKKNQLGEVISSLVTNSTFVDTGVKLKKTYYYTLVAVDAAGNESEILKVKAKKVTGKTEKAPKINTNPVKFSKYLSAGRKGTDVKILQQFLQYQGYYPEGSEINGVYDTITTASVKEYQKSKSLKVTGILDTRTRAALNSDEKTLVLGAVIKSDTVGKWIKNEKMVFYKTTKALIPVTDYKVFVQNGGSDTSLTPAVPTDFLLPLWSELTFNDNRLN